MNEDTKVVRFHTNEGQRTGLVAKVGHKYVHVLLMDNPLRIRKFKIQEQRYMTELPGYPVKQAVKIFRKAARAWHGSIASCPNGVKQLLRRAS